MTNLEWIRTLSEEEFADWLYDEWLRHLQYRWSSSRGGLIIWLKDHKTEPSSSEIPNNCEVKNYCDDCLYTDTCDSKEFFYACTSKATISKKEQVDEPHIAGKHADITIIDEPQTELVNDSPILAKDLVDDEFNPYDEECMRCKHLKLKCEFIPTYCKFESRTSHRQKERASDED